MKYFVMLSCVKLPRGHTFFHLTTPTPYLNHPRTSGAPANAPGAPADFPGAPADGPGIGVKMILVSKLLQKVENEKRIGRDRGEMIIFEYKINAHNHQSIVFWT